MSDLIRREDVVELLNRWGFDGRGVLLSELNDIPAVKVQAQIDEITLRETLHDLIEEQSEGEWDDKTISKDVEIFLTAILALSGKGDQP